MRWARKCVTRPVVSGLIFRGWPSSLSVPVVAIFFRRPRRPTLGHCLKVRPAADRPKTEALGASPRQVCGRFAADLRQIAADLRQILRQVAADFPMIFKMSSKRGFVKTLVFVDFSLIQLRTATVAADLRQICGRLRQICGRFCGRFAADFAASRGRFSDEDCGARWAPSFLLDKTRVVANFVTQTSRITVFFDPSSAQCFWNVMCVVLRTPTSQSMWSQPFLFQATSHPNDPAHHDVSG